jgi:hypothetical protein
LNENYLTSSTKPEGKEIEPNQQKIVKIQQILKLGCAGKFQNQREKQVENV